MDSSQQDDVEDKVKQFKLVLQTLSYSKEDRNSEDIEVLKMYFKDTQLFKTMEAQIPGLQYNMLFSELKLESHKKNRTIFRYGDPSFKYYFILQGSVYVLRQESDINMLQNKVDMLMQFDKEEQEEIKSILQINPHMELDHILKEGSSFGDITLNQKVPRTSTIVCRENTLLASLNSDAYYYIVEKYFSSLYEEKLDFLRKFPFLSVWSNSQLSNLLSTIKLEEFTKNQIVFKKYDPILQDIEAKKDQAEQPMENYKQNIEEFYESFNQLNVQFHRSKKQELKKEQRIALLSVGQSFGISEIAENQSKRQVTVICTSIKAEVYLLDKQVYLNSIKDKQIYNDFIKENKLKQNWRNKQIESSENLFQKIEYRKYNIQTNRSVRQIRGLCDIQIDDSKSIDSQVQRNLQQPANQYNQSYFATNSLPQNKIKGNSLHEQEQTPRKNNLVNVKSEKSKEMNESEKNSLSPRLETNFYEEKRSSTQRGIQIKNAVPTKILKNNFQISKPTKPQINFNLNNRSENDKELHQLSHTSHSNLFNQSDTQSQRSILSSILRNVHTNDQKQGDKEVGFLSGFRISEFSQLQKDGLKKAQQEKEYYSNNSFHNQSFNVLKKMATSPKNFYEEELFNRLSINMTQKELNKKNKQSTKQNEYIQGEKKVLKESLLNNLKGKQFVQTMFQKNSLTERKEINKTVQTPKKVTLKRKKKSLEVIRSEKIDSTNSLDVQQLFQSQDSKDRFQQMVDIESEMHEKFGRLQPNPAQEQDLQSRDSFASSQSLRCFEKSYQDAQAIINKKQALDSLTQKQYFNQIKKSLNLNRDQALKDQILKRASIQPIPTMPIYQSLTSFQRNYPTTPGSSSSNKRLSLFFPTSRESTGTNSGNRIPQSMNTADLIKKVDSEEVKIEENIDSFMNINTERDILHRKNEDVFQYLINKSKQTLQEKDVIITNTFQQQEKMNFKSQRGEYVNKQMQIGEKQQSNKTDEEIKMKDVCYQETSEQIIQLNKIPSKQYVNLQLSSPLNQLNSQQSSPRNQLNSPNSPRNQLNSFRNQQNSPTNNQSQNSLNFGEGKNDVSLLSQKSKEKNKKPFIIDYNFVDSTRCSKHTNNICNKIVKRNIPYDSQIPSANNIIEIEKLVSPLKFKKTLRIECEEISKTPISQQTQAITPSRFSLLQTNPSTVNAFTQQIKQEMAKNKGPSNNTITQFEQSVHLSPNGPASLANAGGFLSNKSTASSSRPKLFKKEVINQEIQNNKPSSSSNQRQFLYQLLNKNNYQQNNNINLNNFSLNNTSQNNNLPHEIPLQSNQKSLYKFQESYYKSPINQSIITAYSSPRQLVFKINNKDSDKNLINTSSGQGKSIILRKNSKNNLCSPNYTARI